MMAKCAWLYLQQGCQQVEDVEEDGDGGVASLHVVDGVDEDEVTWDHQQQQHSRCSGVHGCNTHTNTYSGIMGPKQNQNKKRAGTLRQLILKCKPEH